MSWPIRDKSDDISENSHNSGERGLPVPGGSRRIAVVPRRSAIPAPRMLRCSQVPLKVWHGEMRDKVSEIEKIPKMQLD